MNLGAKKCILVFGGGTLQLSVILKCKAEGLLTIVIDPSKNAEGKEFADFFEIIDGNDFEGTCRIVDKYNVNGIITAATDKPLIMMALVAEKYNFPFFSVNTAKNTTDKYRMKEVFEKNSIPHAKGQLVTSITSNLSFPAILKPRDNSGSRGVVLCESIKEAQSLFNEVKSNTKFDSVLYEEYIDGKEYSIEAIHTETETYVIQHTEKITTEFPYNVELGHIAPAELSDALKNKITHLIERIAHAFDFKNCASHTEISINSKEEITVIETSPRLGGDFITSDLVQLSTSFDIEGCLIHLSLGSNHVDFKQASNNIAGVFYFDYSSIKRVNKTLNPKEINVKFEKLYFPLKINDDIPLVKCSLDRYGYFILKEKNRMSLFSKRDCLFSDVEKLIF